MAKSANLYARIEPDVKEQAEMILSTLGIPASNAINIFYKQIILQRGLPFEVKMPPHPLDMGRMTEAEFDRAIQKGLSSIENGNVEPATKVFADMRKEFDL
ncbi:type II toxin-antitoxin system RelB/DinJ family antitoxin [Chakrabartyella piscis]|uniref:type II toxin-antitoxin system RelB/DinJ family antitoxin n=1 Tax=Chakrabartyella piscis TaxID=2918914 RepID=UPI00295858E0|nr:type II toxin-antitoxin system RelB/DinJ family antitoxin [Chakrabartyella piscis]